MQLSNLPEPNKLASYELLTSSSRAEGRQAGKQQLLTSKVKPVETRIISSVFCPVTRDAVLAKLVSARQVGPP